MNQLNNLPVPTQEKLTRGAIWLAVIAGIIGFGRVYGMDVIMGINNLIGMVSALVGLLLLIAGCTVVGAFLWKIIPAISNWINIGAYKVNAFAVNKYPIIQMNFWHLSILSDIDLFKSLRSDMSANVGKVEGRVEEIDEEIARYKNALRDSKISPATREEAGQQLMVLTETRKPFAGIVEKFKPALGVITQVIGVYEKQARMVSNEIEIAMAQDEASKEINTLTSMWTKFTGRSNQVQINYVTARDNVKRELGASLGRLSDMREQMTAMVNATLVQDEVRAANARAYIEESIQVIDVPIIEERQHAVPTLGTSAHARSSQSATPSNDLFKLD